MQFKWDLILLSVCWERSCNYRRQPVTGNTLAWNTHADQTVFDHQWLRMFKCFPLFKMYVIAPREMFLPGLTNAHLTASTHKLNICFKRGNSSRSRKNFRLWSCWENFAALLNDTDVGKCIGNLLKCKCVAQCILETNALIVLEF